MAHRSNFDSEADIASLVYRADESPDEVLRLFADYLKTNGFNVVGLLQQGRRQRDMDSLTAISLRSGAQVQLFEKSSSDSRNPRLDMIGMQTAGREIYDQLMSADFLIVNRFGRSECSGGGLRSLILRALELDVPVAIAVSQHSFDDWIRFCCGMSVRVRCDLASLQAWWRSGVRGMRNGVGSKTFADL